MHTPLLSIIMPLYNKEKFMRKALDSVLAQTFTDSEIIIINDGSTDRSLEIAKEYSDKCDRIVLLDQKNCGASATRNRGIDAAKGKYVIMMDTDDVIAPDMHEIMVKNAQEHNVDLVVCNYNVTSSGEKLIPYNYGYSCNMPLGREYIEQEVIPNCIGFKNNARPITLHVTLLIKKELLERHNIRYNVDYKKEEDKPVIMQCLRYADSIFFVEQNLYTYIKYANSLIAQYSPRFDNILRTLNFYEELFGEILDFQSELWAKYYIRFFEESISYVYIHKKNVDSVKDEIMHIINCPKSKDMFMRLSTDNSVKKMYAANNTEAIYKHYHQKFRKLRMKLFVRNLIKK